MDLQLEGETAIVTASSSGLGKASAEALAREGANVVVCSRSRERIEAAAEDIREEAAEGAEVMPIEADITDHDDVVALVEATVEAYGGLDHLVTSAGGPPSGPVLDTPEEEWYESYDLLVMSVVRAARAAYPHLADSDAGTITCITSTSVAEPIEGLVLSNSVRRAVIGFVKTVAREWAPDVRANAVLPGAHETPRVSDLIEQSLERGEYEDYEEGLQDWAADIPMDRIGDPQELGDTVAFLTSERAGFVNGVSLPVDGGRLHG
ncbi:SDR family oxidoreductase [Halospeciosus flavus]|uniref:SDR family oxidoreductase n=1 Tax=Halospeciosus flavus TaxID=3032283 RepID=A0ABD5Z7R2_9EURY|nr:SDR family oxidoreductase [Halospeciosus flavus]